MKLGIFLFLAFMAITIISASCEEGQIDINTASVEELDNLVGVGPATAQEIINARPYSSIDDLIRAKYIGESKLQDIKEQGLACVQEEESTNSSNQTPIHIIDDDDPVVPDNEELIEEELPQEGTEKIQEPPEDKTPKTIYLNPKTIKTEDDSGKVRTGYSKYMLPIFGTVLLVLYLMTRRKERKNEWRR